MKKLGISAKIKIEKTMENEPKKWKMAVLKVLAWIATAVTVVSQAIEALFDKVNF